MTRSKLLVTHLLFTERLDKTRYLLTDRVLLPPLHGLDPLLCPLDHLLELCHSISSPLFGLLLPFLLGLPLLRMVLAQTPLLLVVPTPLRLPAPLLGHLLLKHLPELPDHQPLQLSPLGILLPCLTTLL